MSRDDPSGRCLDDLPLVLTVLEVADFLKVSKSCAQELCRSGELRHVRVGRFIRIPRPALATFLGLRDPSEVEATDSSLAAVPGDLQSLKVAQ